MAQAVPTGPLRAAASFCDGLVAAAAGDQESAAAAFEDAAALFAASDAPYELGRARTELARALADPGRRDLARRGPCDSRAHGSRRSRSVLRRYSTASRIQAGQLPSRAASMSLGADRAKDAGRRYRHKGARHGLWGRAICRVAADRGAHISGLDATATFVESLGSASRRIPCRGHRPLWPDNSFDVVTGFQLIHLCANILRALREARRVARPGGNVRDAVFGATEVRTINKRIQVGWTASASAVRRR